MKAKHNLPRIPFEQPQFVMAWYDPVNPDLPLRLFYEDLTPTSIGEAIELAQLVNQAAAEEPELHEVLGVFPEKGGTHQRILIDKTEFAFEIAAAMPCQDEAAVYVHYHSDFVLVDRHGKDRLDTEGHTWQVTIEDHTQGMWFDDRAGDMRLQIADALELRGKLLLKYAKALRREAKAKPITTLGTPPCN